MQKITVSREFDHTADEVWRLLDNFGAVSTYHPAVDSSRLLSSKATGEGARRVCNFYDGTSLKETIFRYDEGRGYSFELSDFALPLKRAISHFDVQPLSSERSALEITVEFRPKFGPLGWLMGRLMIGPTLRRALQGLAQGIDDHLRTGRHVGEGGTLKEVAA